MDPGFRPLAALATLQIVRIAAFGGPRKTALTLLANFATALPAIHP